MDDGSDWSTLTAESGEDAPCWSMAAAGAEDSEVVRCVCEVDEENDFMIQVGLARAPFLSRPLGNKPRAFYFVVRSASPACVGSTAPAWACTRTTSRATTSATTADTVQVGRK